MPKEPSKQAPRRAPSPKRAAKPSQAPKTARAKASAKTAAAAPSSQPGLDTPYHHGHLRTALVEAGLAYLRDHAHDTLSLRELARTLGVSPNAAYRHFADKAALLRAIAAEGFRRFGQAQILAQHEHDDPAEQFKASGQAYVRFAVDHPSLFRLMFSVVEPGPQDTELAAASAIGFFGLLRLAAQTSGLPLGDARAITFAMHAWATVHGLSHLILDGRLQPLATSVDDLVRDVINNTPIPSRAPANP